MSPRKVSARTSARLLRRLHRARGAGYVGARLAWRSPCRHTRRSWTIVAAPPCSAPVPSSSGSPSRLPDPARPRLSRTNRCCWWCGSTRSQTGPRAPHLHPELPDLGVPSTLRASGVVLGADIRGPTQPPRQGGGPTRGAPVKTADPAPPPTSPRRGVDTARATIGIVDTGVLSASAFVTGRGAHGSSPDSRARPDSCRRSCRSRGSLARREHPPGARRHEVAAPR